MKKILNKITDYIHTLPEVTHSLLVFSEHGCDSSRYFANTVLFYCLFTYIFYFCIFVFCVGVCGGGGGRAGGAKRLH